MSTSKPFTFIYFESALASASASAFQFLRFLSLYSSFFFFFFILALAFGLEKLWFSFFFFFFFFFVGWGLEWLIWLKETGSYLSYEHHCSRPTSSLCFIASSNSDIVLFNLFLINSVVLCCCVPSILTI